MMSVWISLVMAGVSWVICAGVCFIVLRLSPRLGWVDRPADSDHKDHVGHMPNSGGIAIFWAVALPILATMLAGGFLATRSNSTDQALGAWLDLIALPGSVTLVGLGLIHMLGILDDRRGLGPRAKLTVEILIAAWIVIFGDFRVLHLLETAWPLWLGYAVSVVISVLWLVTIINAFNMLDNMDGLSAGVAAIAAGIYLAQTLIGDQGAVAFAAALMLGAALGFLMFNFAPARLFMGDSGSLVIGLLLGIISIRTTYIDLGSAGAGASTAATAGRTSEGGPWYGILTPLLVMAVPLYDLASVSVIRLSQGRSPFLGDRQHFSHRLVERGLSQRLAVIVIYFAALATGVGGIMLSRVEPWQAWLLAGQGLAVILMIALLEFGGRRRPEVNA